MKLSAYLSPSRHGVFYFRWPLPCGDRQTRRTIRISLRTKCPDKAGDLARHLASCGRLVRDNKTLARLRQDEMREMVRAYFAASLDRYLERLNDTGLSERSLEALQQELDVHEDAIGGFDDLSDLYLDAGTLDSFRASAGLTEAQWAENEGDLRRELRKARRGQITELLSRVEALEGYSFAQPATVSLETGKAPQRPSASLADVYEDFIAENSPRWTTQMENRAKAFLAVMLEFFDHDRPFADITREDAADFKKVVMALPVNRNTKPETKGLPLLEAVEVAGVKKISLEHFNNHMAMFERLGDWAKRHGRASENVFEGMKIKKPKGAKTDRKPYSYAQTTRLFIELTQNTSGLVKKEDQKWGGLLGLFTGARLNEIAQLQPSDIGEEDGIWFIDISDEGDDKKKLKAEASKRRVPLHSELIKLGFLDFVQTQSGKPRLFMSFSYNEKDGYGRNLGRWFRDTLLPGLDMKKEGLVFHSLRHTMIERLAKADVQEPLYQDIVGHERQGVTQKYYNKGGHTLAQKKEAIDRFTIGQAK
ncbi:MAG TPA: site-specific integrase [Paracoccus sp. (in: a-proteobacteria)]|uniref:site-specific integrase n=1 Tax=uncultured Paracoccus sp. TaxID=189685 RepID=UPI0026277594|nr:site-specific integrase [uncultured Paracoccus sp.]HMQ42372.1 site-specific integrase [Paracoccus sp. (in: a-proteobacteria)]HMR37440.1 site-specific integrase [Paracoccus sp. (in: a-proteobacteria)]